MIETERLNLILMEEEDGEYIVRWRNQKEISDQMFSYRGGTIKQHKIWYEQYIKNENRIEFLLQSKESGEKFGTVGLNNIDHKNQKAEYGILIGENTERGKGYAKEASVAIIKYGFQEMNLQKVYLRVFLDNSKAINLYKKLGFKEEGILKKEIFKNGKFKDVLMMAILREEWKDTIQDEGCI